MANKKWMLVHVSTRGTLPQSNENRLSVEKLWHVKRAIESATCGDEKEQVCPDGLIIMEIGCDEAIAKPFCNILGSKKGLKITHNTGLTFKSPIVAIYQTFISCYNAF